MTFTRYLFIMLCVWAYLVDGGLINQKVLHSRNYQSDPKKRPFCNAFTGCGRKRSLGDSGGGGGGYMGNTAMDISEQNDEYPMGSQLDESQSSLGDLLDLNSEPAVEELTRQIMSQAKLWEAIQEVNQEMLLEKMNNDRRQYSNGIGGDGGASGGGSSGIRGGNNNRAAGGTSSSGKYRKEFPLTFNAQ